MNNSKMRTESYGQLSEFSIVDRLGIYLSEQMVKKYFRSLKKPDIVMLDLGCGYHARLLKRLAPLVSFGYGVDVAVCQEAKAINNLKIYEGSIENSFSKFNDSFFDFILMISVLEHTNDPFFVLSQCRRILKNGGILLINVPTWRGKFFLEASAFKFKLSPELEVDDHKMYYDLRDLWPLIVKAGFRPSMIKMKYYKFGLNLFAACKNKI